MPHVYHHLKKLNLLSNSFPTTLLSNLTQTHYWINYSPCFSQTASFLHIMHIKYHHHLKSSTFHVRNHALGWYIHTICIFHFTRQGSLSFVQLVGFVCSVIHMYAPNDHVTFHKLQHVAFNSMWETKNLNDIYSFYWC